MSSTSSAASAASPSDLREPELFTQLPSVSESPSAKPSSESTGPESPSTTTSNKSEDARNPHLQMELTSSAAGSRDCASPGVSPGSSEARKMTVTSGRKWLGLLQSYGLDGSLGRMCEALLTNRWASSAAFLTWKASNTKPRHLLFQLAPSMPRTDATESGLWPTPTTPSGGGERSGDRAGTGDLNYMARKGLWPTPTVSEGTGAQTNTGRTGGSSLRETVKLWPTPDATPRGPAKKWTGTCPSGAKESLTLQTAVKMWSIPQGGSLNPAWVEWLMGFPEGWTDLKPSEMPLSRKSSSKSGGR